jgi:hypothetical protein
MGANGNAVFEDEDLIHQQTVAVEKQIHSDPLESQDPKKKDVVHTEAKAIDL